MSLLLGGRDKHISMQTAKSMTKTIQGIGEPFYRHTHKISFISVFFRNQSIVKGINALPPQDRLLKFLLDNSADSEETVQCANCDLEYKKQVSISKF